MKMFGGGESQSVTNQVSVFTPTPILSARQEQNLQMQVFSPAKSVETGLDAKNCTFTKFSF